MTRRFDFVLFALLASAGIFQLWASDSVAEEMQDSPQCPNLLKSGVEFDALVLEGVTFVEKAYIPGEGFKRFIVSPPPFPEISPRTPSGIPCLYTPNFIRAINRKLDLRHPPLPSHVLGRAQLLMGLPIAKVFIVTHALDGVGKLIGDFLEQEKRGPTLTLASPIFAVPAHLWKHSSLVRYSTWGELPSGVTLKTSEFHLMGGSGIGCQMNTTWDLVARLCHRQNPGSLNPPRVVIHTGLTYASDATFAGPLLRDYMRNVAGNSFKTYVEKTYVPLNGYHFEIDQTESPSGLGHFNVVGASGAKVQIEYVYP